MEKHWQEISVQSIHAEKMYAKLKEHRNENEFLLKMKNEDVQIEKNQEIEDKLN